MTTPPHEATCGPEGFGWSPAPDDPDTLVVTLPYHHTFDAFAQEHGATRDDGRWRLPRRHLSALEAWVQRAWGVHPRDVIVHDDGAQGPPPAVAPGTLV